MRLHVTLGKHCVLVAAFAAFLVAPGLARAQGPTQAGDALRSHPKIVQLFRSVVAEPSASTVRVVCDGKAAALGTVVAADGWIVTKASELERPVVCEFKDGRSFAATIVGVHGEHDLALLRVAARGLKPVTWRDSKEARVGSWVASVAAGDDPVALGFVSVAARDFKLGDQPPKSAPADAGYLGVGLEDAAEGAKVNQVVPKSPAEKGGLKVNDIITHVSNKKVSGAQSMIEAIQKYKPGAEIMLKLKRGKTEMEVKVKLAKRPAALLGNPQEFMGSTLSKRRGGFPRIVQHDTVIKPADCGGPLVDLDGRTIGINIARAGRTESYAIPSELVRELLPQLMSGQLAPKGDE